MSIEHHAGKLLCPWCLSNTCEQEDEQRFAAYGLPMAPWDDLAEDATWRSAIWRRASGWRFAKGGLAKLHPLFLLPALSIMNIVPDSMHVWELGIAHHVLGNVLWLLVITNTYITAASAKARCEELWDMIARQYHLRGSSCQISGLEIS